MLKHKDIIFEETKIIFEGIRKIEILYQLRAIIEKSLH